jgi:hypothetical protein
MMVDDEMVMHGNQPGVRRATPNSFITQTQQTPGQAPVVSPGAPPETRAMPMPTAQTTPAAAGGQTYATEGFDANKIARGHDSPKYQARAVFERFDPKAGVTPELLDALNQLNIGTFTGGKDKIHVGGNVDPRFGDVTSFDVVRGYNGPGGGQAWQWGGLNGSAAAGNAASAGNASPSINVRALQALMSTPNAGMPGQAAASRPTEEMPMNMVGAPTDFAPIDQDRQTLDAVMRSRGPRRG